MTNGAASDTTPVDPDDKPGRGVIDLLAMMAYAELVAFFRLSDDAGLAPDLAAKGELAGIAATEYGHYKLLRDRLEELGVDPEAAMRPFVEPLNAWHARTEPQSWLESLVKTYVSDGIAGDFYRYIADQTDDRTRALVAEVVSDTGRGEIIAARVRAAVEDDPKLGGRLSLWARRLVGEALSQAQIVAAQRVELAALLAPRGADTGEGEGGSEGASSDLAAVSRVFAKLTEAHSARLEAMGLNG
ncbi:ferritin-like domain-containing protein [Nocardiopsis rhodophaea]|uniref:Ferritin-like domain-containing protein n=1 Tax=Nocardiopsis rhodophaea TaxID=280238 RepID=A0ABP5F4V4_9ACTN